MQGLEVTLPKAVMDPHVARCLKQESTRNLFQVACFFFFDISWDAGISSCGTTE